MTETTASIHVTKLAAANRQLRAAVRLFFLEEDDLAIHTVAAAAYGLITDIKKNRGHDEVGDVYRTIIFYIVRDFQRGVLPKHFKDNPDMMASIQKMADDLPILADSDISDFNVTVSEGLARKYWRGRKFAANFLKHADRDLRSTLPLDSINNLEFLMVAYGSYSDLAPIDHDNEAYVLWIYKESVDGTTDSLPKHAKKMAGELYKLDPDDRKRFCYEWIQRLNETR